MGNFDWGIWYVIIFLYVLFWIRLAAVSKRGKKVQTAAFPVVRSVNKSRDVDYFCLIRYSKYATISIVLTMATVMLQVTARCQYWARPVPWWQPMKIP